tara:strand:- start:261 stop:896 length:636 start_codon:yes stop_codon:yes gene_type:complete
MTIKNENFDKTIAELRENQIALFTILLNNWQLFYANFIKNEDIYKSKENSHFVKDVAEIDKAKCRLFWHESVHKRSMLYSIMTNYFLGKKSNSRELADDKLIDYSTLTRYVLQAKKKNYLRSVLGEKDFIPTEFLIYVYKEDIMSIISGSPAFRNLAYNHMGERVLESLEMYQKAGGIQFASWPRPEEIDDYMADKFRVARVQLKNGTPTT